MEWLLGNEPKEKTANREYVALLNAALQDAHTSNSKLLSSKTLELSKRINPDFEGESFDDLFRHVSNLSDVLPHFALARKKHEASVYGLLARNCSQSDEPNIRRLSDEFLQRALWTIEEIAAAGLAVARDTILNNPNLKWVRQTAEFKKRWAELFPSKQD